MFDLLIGRMRKCTLNSRNCGFRWNTPTPVVIEASEETPPGQGCKYIFLSRNIHPAIMRQKNCCEAQRRHDSLICHIVILSLIIRPP